MPRLSVFIEAIDNADFNEGFNINLLGAVTVIQGCIKQ
jgi:hypothetical protein